MNEKNAIILSCVRCDCMESVLSEYFQNGKYKISVFADSTCINEELKNNIRHINQSTLDSLYLENYNILLVTKRNDKFKFRVVETSEANKFMKIVNDFFKLDK
jgi:hypothetical protein